MVILLRIPVGPAGSAPDSAKGASSCVEVQCREDDEGEVLIHAALLQRLGFNTREIRRLLADHPAIASKNRHDALAQ